VDANLTFSMDRVPSEQPKPHHLIRQAKKSDKIPVMEIAESCFLYSRFHLDPNIARSIADKTKSQWVENCFSGLRGDYLFVAESSGEPAGFLILQMSEENGKRTAVIDLIGVSPRFQRQGVGQSLIRTCINSEQIRFDEIQVGTQLANGSSIQFYQKLGFRLIKSQYVFHYHRKAGAEENELFIPRPQ
jgi:ribosomal protein S18 acetylase RimI-like enzyme